MQLIVVISSFCLLFDIFIKYIVPLHISKVIICISFNLHSYSVINCINTIRNTWVESQRHVSKQFAIYSCFLQCMNSVNLKYNFCLLFHTPYSWMEFISQNIAHQLKIRWATCKKKQFNRSNVVDFKFRFGWKRF